MFFSTCTKAVFSNSKYCTSTFNKYEFPSNGDIEEKKNPLINKSKAIVRFNFTP